MSKLRHQNIALNAFPALGEPYHCSQNLGLFGCYNWMTKHINSMISWFEHSKYMSNCLEEPNLVIEQALNIIDNDLKNTHFHPYRKQVLVIFTNQVLEGLISVWMHCQCKVKLLTWCLIDFWPYLKIIIFWGYLTCPVSGTLSLNWLWI